MLPKSTFWSITHSHEQHIINCVKDILTINIQMGAGASTQSGIQAKVAGDEAFKSGDYSAASKLNIYIV